jgi:replicative DNA helicase
MDNDFDFKEMMNDPAKYIEYHNKSMEMKVMERIGISTGWKSLDYFMRGFHPGKLYVVGARPGDGKTSFCTTLTANILGHSRTWGPVLYFSTELDENEIGVQVAEARAGATAMFPNDRTLNPDEMRRLGEAGEEVRHWMSTRDLHIIHRRSFSIAEMGSAISTFRDGYHEGRLAMIIVDQASRIRRVAEKGIQQNYTNATEAMLNGLETMAATTECPVLLVSQANRDAAKSGDRAFMHHLKHSGAFEEYAHCVMMLENGEEFDSQNVHIDKNRHGPCTSLASRFHGEAHTWEVLGD